MNVSFTEIQQVLCVGAHADDLEIGCGGTVLQLISKYPNAKFHWVVLGASGVRSQEALNSANAFLANAASPQIVIRDFRDGYFPSELPRIKDYFEELKSVVSPDLILTHYLEDRHQDHRVLSELTWNTFRRHLILEYEIPKYDGDLGAPNFFVHLSENERAQKVNNLLSYFPSQADKPWFTADLFDALMRIRGMESNSPSRFAEAFYCRKVRLG